MFDWNPIKQSISAAILQLGQPAVLISISRSGFRWSPDVTETEHEVTIVDTNIAVQSVGEDANLVSTSSRAIYISAEGLEVSPKSSDRVRIGSTEYQIVESKSHSPGGIVLYYEVQIEA